jgi:hypothetical protein
MVRSTTQRRLMRWKPGVVWTRLTISIVHLPSFLSEAWSLSPA